MTRPTPSSGGTKATGRFAATVAYYEAARPPYGAAFFAEVARRLGFDRSMRLLDVGTGPGLLAIGFAPYLGELVGVDPEPAMIAAAREAAARAGVGVRFIEGRFEDLPETLGRFNATTIGRAIHWLDPEPARRQLERLVAPQGLVLVCHAASVADGRNPWLQAYEAVRDRWKSERPGCDPRAFFAGSRFAPREAIRVETSVATPVERLADRVLSMSTTSAERLGDDVPAMREALRAALAPFVSDGAVTDVVEAQAEVFARA